jgi:hypothetical protein
MATKKKGTLTKVGEAVKQATKSVAETAEEYVVTPVKKALGVKSRKTKKPTARKTSVAKSAKTASARKSTAKKSTAKKATAKKTATRKT